MGFQEYADPEGKQLCPTEDAEQAALFRWAEYQQARLPALRWLFAIPNGGYRTKVTAGRMKATGTKAGVPDICLPIPHGGYHGLFIELKRRKGGTLSASQKVWLDILNMHKYKAVRCNGFDEARDTILEYLGYIDPNQRRVPPLAGADNTAMEGKELEDLS